MTVWPGERECFWLQFTLSFCSRYGFELEIQCMLQRHYGDWLVSCPENLVTHKLCTVVLHSAGAAVSPSINFSLSFFGLLIPYTFSFHPAMYVSLPTPTSYLTIFSLWVTGERRRWEVAETGDCGHARTALLEQTVSLAGDDGEGALASTDCCCKKLLQQL